jgi:uncharacterized membrane protein YkgB
MNPVVEPLPHNEASPVVIPIRPRPEPGVSKAPALHLLSDIDDFLLASLRRWSIPILRIALGFVFMWFGALKVFSTSPVAVLINETYSFLPIRIFLPVLGGWEMLIGMCMVFKRVLRCALLLMCIHLSGTFLALCLAPNHFFREGIPFFLTADGEFVIKNMVLMAAGLVIGGYEITPVKKRMALVHRPLPER